jgi:oxalate decarboxylase/phosphoglucose isomerase-like protein (cupin superfamily)
MPPLHVHHGADEIFYVVDGQLSLFVQGHEAAELGPGESTIAPRDVPHVYRVDSDTARWLAVVTPAGFDRFVEEVSEPAEADALPPEGRPHDISRVNAAAARQGIEILGPPGAMPA